MPLSKQLSEHGFKPKRHRGQNFLIDKNILRKIVDAAAVQQYETIVEIGAGTGILTQELAVKAKKVFAVELDKKLIPLLQNNVDRYPNVEVIQDNCLDIPMVRYGRQDGDYVVVANIPYNITSRLIRMFLEGHPRPSRMVLLIQRDVANRMRACVPDMNLLALSVRYYADVRLHFTVSRHCFFPKPKVESAVIEIIPKARHALQEKIFFTLIGAAFKGKRKKVARTLSDVVQIPKKDIEAVLIRMGLSSSARPQELSIEQWLALVDMFNTILSPLP